MPKTKVNDSLLPQWAHRRCLGPMSRQYSIGSVLIFSLLAERDWRFGVGWEEGVKALTVVTVSEELLIG